MKKYFRRGNTHTAGVHTAKHIGVLVLFIIAVVLLGQPPDALRAGIMSFAHPVLAARAGAENDAVGFWGFFRNKMILAQENVMLKKQVRDLELELMSHNVLRRENRELKSFLGRADGREYTAAAVLNRPNQTPYDTVVIDAGRISGIDSGDRVFMKGEVGIGVVESTTRHTALVRLYSSPGIHTEVFFPRNDTAATAEGIGGGNFIVRLPKEIVISVGDEVITPDVMTTPVGVVAVVEQESGDLFQTIRFRTPASPSGLRFVFVERRAE